MKLDIDSQAITLTCPGCGKKFDEKIGRLKRDPNLACPGCKIAITIDAHELRSGMQSVQKQLDALGATLRKIGK